MKIAVPFLAKAIGISTSRASVWAPVLASAFDLAEIDTDLRLTHFMAQIAHESGRLRFVRELWGPTNSQVRYEPETKLSRMLGNTNPGDGRRYMGRGLIQVTGRANCARMTIDLRKLIGESAPDFEANPEKLESLEWAAMSAACYWRTRSLNSWADKGDIYTLTRRINGGTNGLADRMGLVSSIQIALARASAS
jgi:putative chitinase